MLTFLCFLSGAAGMFTIQQLASLLSNRNTVKKLTEENNELKKTLLKLPLNSILQAKEVTENYKITNIGYEIYQYDNYLDLVDKSYKLKSKRYNRKILPDDYSIRELEIVVTLPDKELYQINRNLIEKYRNSNYMIGLEPYYGFNCYQKLISTFFSHISSFRLGLYNLEEVIKNFFVDTNTELAGKYDLSDIYKFWFEYFSKYNPKSPYIVVLLQYSVLRELGITLWSLQDNNISIAFAIIDSLMGYSTHSLSRKVNFVNAYDQMGIEAFCDFSKMYLNLLDSRNITIYQNSLIEKLNQFEGSLDDFNFLEWIQGVDSIFRNVFDKKYVIEETILVQTTNLPAELQEILDYKYEPTLFDLISEQNTTRY
jgi:hypothetical protein